MTWLPNLDRTHPVVQFLYRSTEPILRPLRQVIPSVGGIDFSPIVVFFLLDIIRRFVVVQLFRLMF